MTVLSALQTTTMPSVKGRFGSFVCIQRPSEPGPIFGDKPTFSPDGLLIDATGTPSILPPDEVLKAQREMLASGEPSDYILSHAQTAPPGSPGQTASGGS